MNPRSSNRLSVTEPRAVASGIRAQFPLERMATVKFRVGPAHYRSRFCNLRLAEDVHFMECKGE